MADKTLQEAVQYVSNIYRSVEAESKHWKFSPIEIDMMLKKTSPFTLEYGILMMFKQNFQDAQNTTKH